MDRIRTTLIAFALFTCACAAGAVERPSDAIRRDAPKGLTETFYACTDEAKFSDIDKAYCLSQERERQDTRLNRTYQALLHKLNGAQKKDVIEAERAWLKWQDKTSAVEGALYGSEPIGNLEVTENEIFAICRQANRLEEYLALASEL